MSKNNNSTLNISLFFEMNSLCTKSSLPILHYTNKILIMNGIMTFFKLISSSKINLSTKILTVFQQSNSSLFGLNAWFRLNRDRARVVGKLEIQ